MPEQVQRLGSRAWERRQVDTHRGQQVGGGIRRAWLCPAAMFVCNTNAALDHLEKETPSLPQ